LTGSDGFDRRLHFLGGEETWDDWTPIELFVRGIDKMDPCIKGLILAA